MDIRASCASHLAQAQLESELLSTHTQLTNTTESLEKAMAECKEAQELAATRLPPEAVQGLKDQVEDLETNIQVWPYGGTVLIDGVYQQPPARLMNGWMDGWMDAMVTAVGRSCTGGTGWQWPIDCKLNGMVHTGGCLWFFYHIHATKTY